MCHQLVQPELTFTLQHAMFSVKVRQKLPSELMFAFCATKGTLLFLLLLLGSIARLCRRRHQVYARDDRVGETTE